MIEFYLTNGICGGFSNFSRHQVQLYGRTWPTSEHCFQGLKFYPHNIERAELVCRAATPRIAADMGRDRSHPIRADWDQPPSKDWLDVLPPDRSDVQDDLPRDNPAEPLFTRTKDCVMFEVVRAKLNQHPSLKVELLETKGHSIIEASPTDAYWGYGADRKGHNKLGRILMKIRTEFFREMARSE